MFLLQSNFGMMRLNITIMILEDAQRCVATTPRSSGHQVTRLAVQFTTVQTELLATALRLHPFLFVIMGHLEIIHGILIQEEMHVLSAHKNGVKINCAEMQHVMRQDIQIPRVTIIVLQF